LPEALLIWLENAPPGEWMRASGVWTYGLVNLVHILGIATLFGSVLALDLRLLGLWPRVPIASIEVPTLPLAVTGFCVAALSGAMLISTNATEYAGNPFLVIKFVAIGLALANIAVAQRLPAWRNRHRHDGSGPSRALALIGGASLACWLVALSAGRMIGYW
jgi:hypothetical protein